jgi:uncharacterized protein (DUF952 family)
VIFHITTSEAWAAARTSGMYRAASLDSEGFIHFSFASQLADTAALLFAGVSGLVVLSVDDSALDIVVEDGFPHLYAPLPVTSVIEVRPLSSVL